MHIAHEWFTPVWPHTVSIFPHECMTLRMYVYIMCTHAYVVYGHTGASPRPWGYAATERERSSGQPIKPSVSERLLAYTGSSACKVPSSDA